MKIKANPFRVVEIVRVADDVYCVRSATLVEPRVTLPASLNRTKIRLVAGSNGTLPAPWTKIPKVGVALALICVVTLGPIAEMHSPLAGFV